MILRYNYRLYPTKEQEQLMKQSIGCQRFIWNHFLDEEIKSYKETGKFQFYNLNASKLTKLKQELVWLKNSSIQSLQQTLIHLNKAILACARRKATGFPKFKKRKEFEGSLSFTNIWDFNKEKVKVPKFGWFRWKYHRELPSKPRSATIKLDGNKWYISLVVEKQKLEPVKLKSFVGLDLNSNDLVVTSDGQSYTNPKFFKQSKKKLKRVQKQFIKTIKDSKRRLKKQLKVRKVYKKITDQRKDYLHKISSQITNDYDFIGLESLNVKAMQRFNGRMVQDAGWTALVQMIEYKAKLKGKAIQKIDGFAPSSKTCNSCGWINKEQTLKDRIFECKGCDSILDRDANAALNIRDWAIDTAGLAEIYERGDTSTGDLSSDTSRHVLLNR